MMTNIKKLKSMKEDKQRKARFRMMRELITMVGMDTMLLFNH